MAAIMRSVRSLRGDRPVSATPASRVEFGDRRGPAMIPALAAYAGPVLLFALMLARWASGLPAVCQLPYWYLSYTEGFIRRALVGTFTLPLLVGHPLPAALVMIAAFGSIAGVALIIMLTVASGRRGAGDPVVLAFVFSGALPWLAHDLGTLDTIVVLVSLGAFLLIDRGNGAGLMLCAIGPLIHEGALFLLAPLLAGMWLLRPERRWAAVAGGAAALMAALALWLFSTTDFAWPAGMPMPVDESFVRWELGQSLRLFPLYITPALLLFAVAPCVVIAVIAGQRAGWRLGGFVFGGVLLTWSVALIAFDTERLFAWGPFTAIALAQLAQRTVRPEQQSRPGAA